MSDLVLPVLVVGVLVAAPLVSAAGSARRKARLAAGDPAIRRRMTLRSIAIQWTTTAVLGTAWLADGRGLTGLRLGLPHTSGQWLAAAAVLSLFAMLSASWLRAARSPEALAHLREVIDPSVLGVMPRTRADGWRFAALSITAGFCEELVYRGIALALLTGAAGLWPAVALTSVAFGASHAYQGPRGMLRTGLVGLVLGASVVATGSLVLMMVVHALADLFQGALLARAVATTSEEW